jgi:drug/metabolite transporter (DMT)-like permease
MASRAQYGHAALVGLLLHAGYLGGVFYSISLGVAAGVFVVVVSLQPVLTAVLASRVLDERLVPRQWLGLLLGIAGVALVVGPGIAATAGSLPSVPLRGFLACLVALASGTAAALHQKRYGQGVRLVWGTAVQYAAASAVLLAAAAATEDMDITWTADFVLALVWLVLALSCSYWLLLRRGTASGVSSLLYLVPPAVAVEAFLLFGERLSPAASVGVAVTALGVALVVTPPQVRAPGPPVVASPS